MKEFGILLFGHTRPLYLVDILESLQKQNALQYVNVWLDGHQGLPELKAKTEQVYTVVSKYPVAKIYRHNGNLGFRKLILQALSASVQEFKYIMVLEDDCFPSRNAVNVFREELGKIDSCPDIFSIYGHPFLVKAEKDTCTRFQGWGWGTVNTKLKQYLDRLIDCYFMTEEKYLQFVGKELNDNVRSRLDVTPPRLPSLTLQRFYAWDETLALLTAIDGMVHKKTPVRTIYNFGIGSDASRFKEPRWYIKPPFNMVRHEDIWNYF